MWLLDRRYIRSFDWVSLLLVMLLSVIGLAFVFSATYKPEVPFSLFFKKQLFGIATGFIIYFCCCFCDYRTLERWGYFLYFATIGLLVLTILKGSIGMGAQRWINLGLFKFQPSELAKLFFPPFFSFYLYTEKDSLDFTWKEIFPVVGILGASALLIIKQPDLGTGLIILFSGITLLWMLGLDRRVFIYGALFCAISSPVLYKCLKPYQRKRIEVFLGAGDTKKERYQIEQSKIAIGSGGLLGKGYLQGTQNRLAFLPESRTDFIFSVLCEELGFIGALLLLILYIALFMRFFWVINTIQNAYAQLLGIGLVLPLIISTVINISMVSGLMPVVGIPLPFMSYGISHIWISFMSLGMYNSIAMRRFYLSMNKEYKT